MYKFIDKKVGSSINVNELLAQELHKPLIKKFKRIKVYSRFKDNIWAADLAEMGSLFTFNSGVQYLLCIIDVFTKYPWVKILTNEKVETVLDDFIGIVNEAKLKPDKLWVDQGREFYNNLMQKWLK